MIRRLLLPAAIWLAGCAFLLLLFQSRIAVGRFDDPDDLMRLQQVRDLMAGQGWYDVSQHRMAPPAGLPMHWSRLVDLPIAALILPLRPLLGPATAEVAAAALVPLLTYGVALAILWRMTLALSPPLAGRGALLVLALAALNPGTFVVMRPLAIDHHGWQVPCGLAVALGVIRGGRHGALLAGIAAALWTHISLEGLPFTVAAGALLGLRACLAPDRDTGLPLYLATFAGGAALLFLIVHGGSPLDRTTCDAVSPIHLALLAFAATGSLLALRQRGWWRWGALGATAGLAAVAYRLAAPQCAAGPFAGLDPLVYRLWYLHVAEGRPVWEGGLAATAFALAYPIVGLIGAGLAWRGATEDARRRWADYALLLAVATLIGSMVLRAGAFANLLALPGGAALLLKLLRSIGRSPSAPLRVLGCATTVLALLPPVPAGAIALFAPDRPVPAAAFACIDRTNLSLLNRLPPATIVAPLNATNSVLVATHHRLAGGGYHRGSDTMADVLRIFTAPDAEARAAAARRGADYLLLCPGGAEMALYAGVAPQGVAARLQRGETPPHWLMPVAVPGLTARMWRIVPIAGGGAAQ